MPYLAVGPGVRLGARTLPELAERLAAPSTSPDTGLAPGVFAARIGDQAQPAWEVRHVTNHHPEYDETGQYVGGEPLSDADAAELARLMQDGG
jgi:hypothetical protein